MSNAIPILVAVFALVAGLVGATFAAVLMVAGMPNSQPANLWLMRIGIIVVGVVTLACAVATVVLIARGKPWAAAVTGGIPAAAGLAVVLILTWMGV